jgi:hypothetical protein
MKSDREVNEFWKNESDLDISNFEKVRGVWKSSGNAIDFDYGSIIISAIIATVAAIIGFGIIATGFTM